MNYWFECKVRYEKLDESGKSKKVTDTYMVDALSFSEAEERLNKEVTPFLSGEFSVAGIRKAKISEIFSENEEGDKWFRCKVNFVSIDEENGKERKIAANMLVLATDIQNALDNLRKGLKDTISDCEISSITETPIMDILHYTIPEQ